MGAETVLDHLDRLQPAPGSADGKIDRMRPSFEGDSTGLPPWEATFRDDRQDLLANPHRPTSNCPTRMD